MPSQQPIARDDDHRVIPFRPRNIAKPVANVPLSTPRITKLPVQPPIAADSAQESSLPRLVPPTEAQPARRGLRFRDPTDAADFRQRMVINFAALFFVLFLTGAGVWLATTIRDLRRTQACLLAGRPDCPRILNTPPGPPAPSRQFGDRAAEHP